MKTVYTYLRIIPILIPLFFSCSKEGPPGEPGPEYLTGDVQGRVVVQDEFGDTEMSPAGIHVALKSDGLEQSTVTDNGGEFLLTGLQTGHYYIEFTKDGIGKEAFKYIFLGGNQAEVISNVVLRELSGTIVEEFKVEIESGYLVFDGTISPPSTDEALRNVALYFYKNDSVSNRIFNLYIPLSTRNMESSTFHYEKYINDNDFQRGQPVYIVAYGLSSSSWWNSAYWDESLGMTIYNMNPVGSKRASVMIP